MHVYVLFLVYEPGIGPYGADYHSVAEAHLISYQPSIHETQQYSPLVVEVKRWHHAELRRV